MANVLERQITLDGRRNCVVKMTGSIDTANVAVIPVLSLNELSNAEARAILSGLRVDTVDWSMSDGLVIALEWNSDNPQHIYQLSGRGEIDAENMYGGFTPDTTRAGYDGGINLRVQGYPPGGIANYSVVVQFVKLYRV